MLKDEFMIALKDPASRASRKNGSFGYRKSPTSSDVAEEARRVLERDPLFRGRASLIKIECCEGQLVLEGRLPSFYLKQMLQTVLRDVEGAGQIDNRISVDWP